MLLVVLVCGIAFCLVIAFGALDVALFSVPGPFVPV
jgi:hypothetical protein